ncbi:MAG TPA: histone deacetylase [Anaeromyxobacteraceae bacterium]|nr:histone deacetylase [Anaeromyxobacteraceae bacterium]
MSAPLLLRLRLRAARRELPVWYSPAYRLPITGVEASVGLEPRRADYAWWWLLDSGTVSRTWVRAPRRITYQELDRAHGLDLLDSLGRPEALARIFAVDPSDVPVDELMNTVRLACGGTLEAARAALRRRGATVNLQGGFHHAGPNSAGGFCPVNDVAVALAALRAEGFGGRCVVLDLDAHPPDGIAACLARDRSAWIGSISGSDWGPLPGVDETVLRKRAGDATYLMALVGLLGRMPRAALAFVLAGGDVLAGDRFGKLGLTLAGARQRDLAVARALEGVPSVWLPAGGYHKHAWRVLAGTAMALAARSADPIPERYDALTARFRHIAGELSGADLAEADGALSAGELEEALGLGRDPAARLLLGYYTAAGLEHALHRYGILDHLGRVGYGAFRVELDRAGVGERMRLTGEAGGETHLLVEWVLERRRVAGGEALFIHWLSLRNPRARFSALRPRLPGQDVPGLGIAREVGEMLALMARRLGLAGVAFRPAHYHTAFSARHNFAFVDAARQGRFEALVRDLRPLPLGEATAAVSEGRVALAGATYAWEADDMALWIAPHAEAAGRAAEIERVRERSRFTVRTGAPRSASAADGPSPRPSPGARGG